jgi:hypothetical protein
MLGRDGDDREAAVVSRVALSLGVGRRKTENTDNCFDPTTTANKMRYYKQKYPEVDELVMVQVRQIAEMGAYVKLVRDPERRPRRPADQVLTHSSNTITSRA